MQDRTVAGWIADRMSSIEMSGIRKFFERAAEMLLTCYATGKPLRFMPHATAELTKRQWLEYSGFPTDHLNAVKEILDREEPEYRR